MKEAILMQNIQKLADAQGWASIYHNLLERQLLATNEKKLRKALEVAQIACELLPEGTVHHRNFLALVDTLQAELDL